VPLGCILWHPLPVAVPCVADDGAILLAGVPCPCGLPVSLWKELL
jgi:hypothetical protein